MTEIFVAFLTGLTTGGLSCLAIQGGLLASSLAHQIEQDMSAATESQSAFKPRIAQPIALFLLAKLLAYTIFGFLLGALGSLLQLTPLSRAILQIVIGVFMIGNALRMVNVHPIFRYFSIEPPQAVTRAMRRIAKNGADVLTPLTLGVMTVFIPCGVTQAMMAVALGSGSPAFGATILFSFVLGTTPVFFALAYFTTKLGARLEKTFMRVVAVVLLVLGLVSIEAGLNLAGSPYSFTNLSRSVLPRAAATWMARSAFAQTNPLQQASPADSGFGMAPGYRAAPSPGAATQAPAVVVPPPADVVAAPTLPGAPAVVETITLNANNDGYAPETLKAPAGKALLLNVVTNNTLSCSRAFVIPALNVEVILPQTGTTPIDIPAQKAGTLMRFSCSMGMYTGQIAFE